MDASRRNFLRGAVAAVVAAHLPIPVTAEPTTASEVLQLQGEQDERLLSMLRKALDRAMNPPWVMREDGTGYPMDTATAWETLDVIYKRCEERGLVSQRLTVNADQQCIGWSNPNATPR